MPKHHYIIPVFVPHLGCPHACVFCDQQQITGAPAEVSGADVEAALKKYLANIPHRPGTYIELAFYGGSFTGISLAKQSELLAPGKQALDQGLIDALRISTRPDYISREILANLRSFGVKTIELGVQSMIDHVLIAAGRGHTVQDIILAARMIKEEGFQLGMQMMIGLPGDTTELALLTGERVVSLAPDFVRIYPTLVIEGTQLAEMYYQGLYVPLNLQETIKICKELVYLFDAAGIKVIRIGLQASEKINLEGSVLAGPFHPAIGEMVEAAIAYDLITDLLTPFHGQLRTITLHVNHSDLSIVRGHRNENVRRLQDERGIKHVYFVQDNAIPRGTIVLHEVDGVRVGVSLSRGSRRKKA